MVWFVFCISAGVHHDVIEQQNHIELSAVWCTPTFSEREQLTHLLSGLAQAEKLPLLLEQFDEVNVAVVVKGIY